VASAVIPVMVTMTVAILIRCDARAERILIPALNDLLLLIGCQSWRAQPPGVGGKIFRASEANLTVVTTLDDVLRHIRQA